MQTSRCFSALLLTLGLVASSSGKAALAGPAHAASATSARVEPSAASSPYDAQVKMLGGFTDRHGFLRKYVLVSPGLSDKQLLTLARQLHRIEPDTWFWFIDDDSQIHALLASLPKSEKGDDRGFPTQYVQQHVLAHVELDVGSKGRQWVLKRGAGSELLAPL